jgi:hypothetical protein
MMTTKDANFGRALAKDAGFSFVSMSSWQYRISGIIHSRDFIDVEKIAARIAAIEHGLSSDVIDYLAE